MERTMAQVSYHLKLDERLVETLDEYCDHYLLKRNRALNELVEDALRRDKESRLAAKWFN